MPEHTAGRQYIIQRLGDFAVDDTTLRIDGMTTAIVLLPPQLRLIIRNSLLDLHRFRTFICGAALGNTSGLRLGDEVFMLD